MMAVHDAAQLQLLWQSCLDVRGALCEPVIWLSAWLSKAAQGLWLHLRLLFCRAVWPQVCRGR
jgi:hypothetical protein